MFASLAVATLGFALATASLHADNTTSTGSFTVVPFIPVLASSESNLETPHTEDVPSTYMPTGTPSSLTDYGDTGTTHSPTTPTYGPSVSFSTSTRRIVHTENSQQSLETPTTSTPPPTVYPSPIALSSYPTVAHPTLPVTSSPIALSSYPTVAHPTLPVTSSPIALTSYPSVAPPTLPVSQPGPTTYIPAIVHTEQPAESLDVPPSQTHVPLPGHETTTPVVPVPEGNANPGTSAAPTESIAVPATLVTTITEHITTMSGGETMMVPALVTTLETLPVSTFSSTDRQTSSSDEPSETAEPVAAESGSGGNQEGTAFKFGAGMWSCSFVGMLVGAVLLI